MSAGHPLHRAIGSLLEASAKEVGAQVLLDPACGGQQYLPLFLSENKSNATKFCNVDALIVTDNRVRVVVEIEESNTKPTQVCGKFLTSALSAGFIHELQGNELIRMDEAVVFIQVLDTEGLNLDRSSKFNQWENLASSIQALLPLPGSTIASYALFHGRVVDFEPHGAKRASFVDRVQQALMPART